MQKKWKAGRITFSPTGFTDFLCGLYDQILTGHFTDDGVEISLILVVDESVMEHPLTFMAEKPEDLVLVSHLTRLTLQNA